VNRNEHFFGEFVELMKQDPNVNYIIPLPLAFVPLIKLMYKNSKFDILCAKVDFPTIPPKLDIYDDATIEKLDEKSVLSLNGLRTLSVLLKSIENIETFRNTLRCIRRWAKSKGIYSNIFGYLGGMS